MKPVIFFHGQEQVSANLRQFARRFPDKALMALRTEAELIMARSKRDFVPVHFGVLRASGYVKNGTDEDKNKQSISVTMGYGGAASAYALAVHENPGKYDPPSWQGVDVQFHPEGHGRKYLERPIQEALPTLLQRIGNRLKIGDGKSPNASASSEPSEPSAPEGGGGEE